MNEISNWSDTERPRRSVAARSTAWPGWWRRSGRREEIANLVVYVASPLSSATNGAALRVDGGVTPTFG